MNTELKNLHEQWGLSDVLVMLREVQEKKKWLWIVILPLKRSSLFPLPGNWPDDCFGQ